MRRLPVLLHVVVYKNDRSSAFLPGCACVHLPTMTPRVKPPHTLVSVLHWLWYCRATALSALASLTLLLGKNTLPFPAFGNLNFVSPPHRRAYTSIPKSCPNIRFPHQQDFFPIRSVTKSSTDENLVEKFKIFVQDFCTRFCTRACINVEIESVPRICLLTDSVDRSCFAVSLDSHAPESFSTPTHW